MTMRFDYLVIRRPRNLSSGNVKAIKARTETKVVKGSLFRAFS